MRQPPWATAASWVLERAVRRPMGEALAGDLLEELGAGRSATWYCRQVLVAVGQSAAGRTRQYAVALGYSLLWSLIFPRCSEGLWGRFLPAEFDRWSALEWPYSSLLLVTGGLLPSVSCLYLGLLTYLLLVSAPAPYARARPSGLRLLGSLSLSLNVLLVAKICLSCLGGGVAPGPHLALRETAFGGAQASLWSAPLTLSLWAALVCVLRSPRVGDDRTRFAA